MATPVHPPRQAPIFNARLQDPTTLRGFFGVFRYSRRALELVWSTNRAADTRACRLHACRRAFCRPRSPTSVR